MRSTARPSTGMHTAIRLSGANAVGIGRAARPASPCCRGPHDFPDAPLRDPFHAGWPPCSFARRQDRRRRRLRPVQAHHEIDRVIRRRKPVRFQVCAGAVLLDVDGQRAVCLLLHLRPHRRVDEVAVDRIFDQELAFAVVHRDRPEGIHRRQLAGGEGDGVVVLGPVERRAGRVRGPVRRPRRRRASRCPTPRRCRGRRRSAR